MPWYGVPARGFRALLERVKLELGIHGSTEEPDSGKLSVTTADGEFTVRTVACFGRNAPWHRWSKSITPFTGT